LLVLQDCMNKKLDETIINSPIEVASVI
jgi:hypothetical protein